MQYQRPALVQRQELRMTPQLLQSIHIMTLPLQDLQVRVHEEVESNPALELVRERPTVSIEDSTEAAASNDGLVAAFENSSDPGFVSSGRFDDRDDSKRMFMENALARPETLHEHLLWQLRLQPLTEAELEVGELLIRNVDHDGFHQEAPETLVDGERQDMVKRMLTVVQRLEPAGCCTSNYTESLIVQSEQLDGAPAWMKQFIATHLPHLEKRNYKDIAKDLGVSIDDVERALDQLKSLHPFPGRLYAGGESRYIIPDLILRKRDGEFVLVLNDEEVPVLRVERTFSELSSGEDKDARRFAAQRVKDARWFIQSVDQRNETLLRVGRSILDFQRDFFLRGRKYLAPLTLKDVAAEVEVSEATVSRVTNGKYLQTEWGIFELKHFFSNSVSSNGSGSSRFSKAGVKEILREILEEHSAENVRLSDQKLSDILAERGISVARRTVAKYRKELRIDSSYDR